MKQLVKMDWCPIDGQGIEPEDCRCCGYFKMEGCAYVEHYLKELTSLRTESG